MLEYRKIYNRGTRRQRKGRLWGAGLLKELSKQMMKNFGKGFTVTNLNYMSQFYLMFPNGHVLRNELDWIHY